MHNIGLINTQVITVQNWVSRKVIDGLNRGYKHHYSRDGSHDDDDSGDDRDYYYYPDSLSLLVLY